MNSNYWILVSLLLIGFNIEQSSSHIRIRQTYGETCSKEEKCEGSAWLKCHNGICNCTNPEEMKWDYSNNRCVALAGEKCNYESLGDTGNIVEKISCIENSNCNSNGFCECSSIYYASREGICTRKKGFEKTCIKDDECNSEESLHCSEGVCKCNATVSAYSTWYRTCVGLVTENSVLGKCVPNAKAELRPRRRYNGTRFHCVCESDFITSVNKLCVRPFSEQCSKTEPCDETAKMACKSKLGGNPNFPNEFKCQCRDSKHHYYDPNTRRCTSLVHGMCESRIDCTENAMCIDNEGFGIFRCECNKGFVVNREGKCELEFGASCAKTTNLHCDRYANLVCKNGVCSCGDDNLVFDKNLRKCVGLPGSRCEMSDKCIENSKCVESFKGLDGTCECNEGLKNTGMKCEADDGKNFIKHKLSTTTTVTTQRSITQKTSQTEEDAYTDND